MLATSFIYLCALALFIFTGIAVSAVLNPRGRWLTAAAPALGAATIVTLVYPLGFLLPGSVVLVLLCLVVPGMLAAGLWRRLVVAERAPLRQEVRAALAIPRGEGFSLVLGAAAGMVLLIPVFALGFPTTISPDIADGWVRSVLGEWLMHNPLIDSGPHLASERPIGSYSGQPETLGAGLEYLIGFTAHLLGRRTFETALPVTAVGAPIALAGWVHLHGAITRRPPAFWQASILTAATLSPAFILPFAENYLTQFFSLALWPFAVAATCLYARRRRVGTALTAAIGLAAVAGVYPPLLPWLGPPGVLLVLVTATGVPPRAAHLAPPLRRAAAAAMSLAILGLTLVLVAPIILYRAYDSVVAFSARLNSNEAFPLLTPAQDLAVLLSGLSQYSVAPFAGAPSTANVASVLVLLLGAVAVGLLAVWKLAPGGRSAVVAIGAGLVGVTLVLYLRYKHGSAYGYGTFKALVSGGALLGGMLLVALSASADRLLRPARLIAAGVCLAVWAPISAGLLQRQHDGVEGFRAADRWLIDELDALPPKQVVLVEGAADTASSFHMRMSAGYAAAVLDRPIDGLGTTATYFTGGGSASWRPSRPWRYVVASDTPSPFTARRRTLRRAAPLVIQDAPPLDVTPYAVPPGGAPAPGSANRRFWTPAAPDSPAPVDYIGGPVELVVSNRQPRDTRVQLELELSALGHARVLRIASASTGERRVRLRMDRPRRVVYELPVRARSTAVVALDPGAPALNPDGTVAPLVGLTRVDVQ